MTGALAGWADAHVRRLGGRAARLDVDLAAEAEEGDRGGGRLPPEPGLPCLRDLRALHLAAARASLACTALGQGTQAVRDAELLGTVTACHAQTVRTLKWTVQKVKEVSPQALASSTRLDEWSMGAGRPHCQWERGRYGPHAHPHSSRHGRLRERCRRCVLQAASTNR